jgi:soluble lytic murein transglycosylase
MKSWFFLLLLLTVAGANAAELRGNQTRLPWHPPSHATLDLLKQSGKKYVPYTAKRQDHFVMALTTWLAIHHHQNVALADAEQLLQQHPNWPEHDKARRLVETKLSDATPPEWLEVWFQQFPPLSTHAQMLEASAALSLKRSPEKIEKATNQLRQLWQTAVLNRSDQEWVLKRYGSMLATDDHHNRMVTLHCRPDGPLTREASQHLGNKMPTLAGKVKALLHIHHSQPHPCAQTLQSVRAAEQGRDQQAVALLAKAMPKHPDPSLWWKHVFATAREAIKAKSFSQAYHIIRHHGFKEGVNFAEGEWLSGWVALRHLHDPANALMHFERLYAGVNYAASLSRAAYWAGRAAAELGQLETSRSWYEKAKHYSDTFYGQLAWHELSPSTALVLPASPKPTPEERAALSKNQLAKAAYYLFKAGKLQEAKLFFKTAMDQAKSKGERVLIAEMPRQLGNVPLGVEVAKYASYHGVIIPEIGYPYLRHIQTAPLASHVVHGIIRQESNFYPHAKSSAGATGLMQLIPKTAQTTAKRMNVPFASRKLQDSAYNVRVGAQYFHELVEKFGGSYILALAAYNAGPTNAWRWVDEFGDPRQMHDTYQVVDWIESITYGETRTYVQRVLANIYMYQCLQPGLTGSSSVTIAGWLLPHQAKAAQVTRTAGSHIKAGRAKVSNPKSHF